MTIIEARLTWTGQRFERDLQIEVAADGTIARVGKALGPAEQTLDGRALLPGFVNGHSHAFQRGLRGSGEDFPKGAGSFWTWRKAMYGLVEDLDADQLHRLSTAAFGEMRAAGFTSVGEFHYLHHRDASSADYAFDDALLAAAEDAGIRLVLLSAFYHSGGIGKPLENAQQRFASADLSQFWGSVDRLAKRLRRGQSVGVVAHSIRAVNPSLLSELAKESAHRALPLHMHVEEQPQEIEDCVAHYGKTPMQLILGSLQAPELFTAVHCTHSQPDELRELLKRGGYACICPLTEANLGDGLSDGAVLRAYADQITIGSDSNARIDALEELRWLEYGQRLRTISRGIFRNEDGAVADTLLTIGTRNGARSLGLAAGQVAAGQLADLTEVNLDHPALAGVEDDALLAALIFGCGSEVIAGTWVAGVRAGT